MKKSITVLIEDLMKLEVNFATLYKNIAAFEEQENIKMKNVASILSREELRHVELYKELIKKLNNKPSILIDEELINKAKEHLISFKLNLNSAAGKTPKELLMTALEFEISNGILLKQILEILLTDEQKDSKELVIIFEGLIVEEQKHAINIKKVLKI